MLNKMSYLLLVLHLNLVTFCLGWQYFTYFDDIVLKDSAPELSEVHSEYFFGDCSRASKRLMVHIHLDHLQVLGKRIVRGWLSIQRIPICIILKARSHPNERFRSTSYNFQICVSRITYLHSQRRFRYFYYEWNLPDDMMGGMDWDLYFYGPISDEW